MGIVRTTFWWTILVALIVCTGIINTYNFMDGINGITGGYLLVVVASVYMLVQGGLWWDTSLPELRVLVFAGEYACVERRLCGIDEEILWMHTANKA